MKRLYRLGRSVFNRIKYTLGNDGAGKKRQVSTQKLDDQRAEDGDNVNRVYGCEESF